MVKKRKEIIPKPKSCFIKIKCPNCGTGRIVFDHTTILIRCKVCNEVLAEPTGGKALVRGKIVAKYG